MADIVSGSRAHIFLSFDPGDTAVLAARLHGHLQDSGFAVHCDSARADEDSKSGIARSDAVVAVLSPLGTRSTSICMRELELARFGDPPRPIIPVIAIACEVPLIIFRLQRIEMEDWEPAAAAYRQGLTMLVSAIEAALIDAGSPGTPEPDA